MTQFFIKYIDESYVLPERELTSAVFLIAIKGTKILAIENEKGWDIPGGHLEEGETIREGLVREVQEEGGASFEGEKILLLKGAILNQHFTVQINWILLLQCLQKKKSWQVLLVVLQLQRAELSVQSMP